MSVLDLAKSYLAEYSKSEIILHRSGMTPLRFHGRELARFDGCNYRGVEHQRYHDLELYKSDVGTYVLHIYYQSLWHKGGEPDKHTVYVTDCAEDIAFFLEKHDCTAGVLGFPPGEHFAAKQERMMKDLVLRFRAGVSHILDALPAEAPQVEQDDPVTITLASVILTHTRGLAEDEAINDQDRNSLVYKALRRALRLA